MTDEMAERTVVSVADLREAAEAVLSTGRRGYWGAGAVLAIEGIFEELGLDAPVVYSIGRVEWRRDDG